MAAVNRQTPLLGRGIPVSELHHGLDKYIEAGCSRPGLTDPFDETYGASASSQGRTKRPAKLIASCAREHEQTYGQVDAFVFRSPARVNLRGMHIDNNGGYCNSVCIEKDTILVFSTRKLDPAEDSPLVLQLRNPDTRFTPSHVQVHSRTDYTADQAEAEGWSKYAFGAVEALERRVMALHGKDRRSVWSFGIDGTLASDIPAGAGLSSSHALALCLLGATCAANGIELQEVDELLAAQSTEHLVGVKSGLMDHGSMIYGKVGQVLHARFYDLKVPEIPSTVQHTAWPEEATIVVANSKLSRKLAMTGNAIEYSLPRLGCSIAFPIMRTEASAKGLPESEADWDLATVLQLLRLVPAAATIDELLQMFPDHTTEVMKAVNRFIPGGKDALGDKEVPLRGSTLFVLAECARARGFFAALEQRDLQMCGELMRIGHAGDDPNGDLRIDQQALDEWTGTKGGLAFVPGIFKAGHAQLDELCQLLEANGAVGSSLTGAGMGGCVVALYMTRAVAEAAVAAVLEQMPKLSAEEVFVVTPVAGRGLLDLQHFQSFCVKLGEAE